MKKLSLNTACKIAIKRGGLCLSNKYINGKSHLQWKCIKNHKWNATLNNIKYQNIWCPYCAGKIRQTLEIAKIIAINKGGECISNKYINGSSHLRWKCIRGHEWSATLQSVKNKDRYKDAHSKLTWNCSKGHIWNATFANIKYHGSWCPHCSNKYTRENLCREIISKFLGKPSNIRRPNFLKTSKYPVGLELDIYYPEYGFAIEVQG
ncbi:hypothetical protein Glove_661g7 [Diversispora epigaea]|uniref:Zinc-ribbon domain-containing protein n=1 Tax=Diversispora epigaea TaxID=1348612 RepID=A0A397G9T9_9GLOM|nr:hypothetical protein Glove_661g7 [Diversispora epigaea]